MDPHVVFDCQKILPNRFALALAAAARSRALNRGAESRLDRQGVNASELALLEIASGAFVEDELAPYLFPSRARAPLLAPPSTTPEFRGDGGSSAAAAPVSCPQEMVH